MWLRYWILSLSILICSNGSEGANGLETLHACEGDVMDISCPIGEKINIIRANYGRFTVRVCNKENNPTLNTECGYNQSTKIAKERCSDRRHCMLPATNDVFADMCPKNTKYLEVQFNCTEVTKPTPAANESTGSESSGSEVGPEVADPNALEVQKTTTAEIFPEVEKTTPGSIKCESLFKRNVQWPVTDAGDVASMQCPNNELNFATWYCLKSGEWSAEGPNFGACVAEKLVELNRELSSAVSSAPDPKIASKIAENLQDFTRHSELYGGDTLFSSQMLQKLSKFSENEPRAVTDLMLETASNLLQEWHDDSWEDLTSKNRRLAAANLLSAIEENSLNVASELDAILGASVKDSTPNVLLEIAVVTTENAVRFPAAAVHNAAISNIEIPAEALRIGAFLSEDPVAALGLAKITFTSFHRLGAKISPENRRIVSKVLSASVNLRRHPMPLEKSVVITLETDPEEVENLTNPQCVFWDPQLESWSSNGCRVRSHSKQRTICECDHLTHFAVLMDVEGIVLSFEHQLALTVITYVGCAISISCLVCALFAFCAFRGIQNDRTTIHKNLCFCLLVAETVFLFGITQTGNRIFCGMVAGILHYFFLAAFAWMFLEGFQLYAMLIEVFEAERSRRRYFYLIGYGIPMIIVGIATAVDYRSYGTPRYCWLNNENYFVFSFVGPVAVVIMANLFFLIMALMKMGRHMRVVAYRIQQTERSTFDNIRIWLKAAFVLLFLLGLTWAAGLFYISHSTIYMAYIFTVLNSLQGLFIFIFHVLMNEKMRKEYRNFLRRSHWLPDWIRGSFSDLGKPIRLPASGGHSSSSGSDQGPVSPSTATTSNSYPTKWSLPTAPVNFVSQPPLVDLYKYNTSNCNNQKSLMMLKNGYSTIFCPPPAPHPNFLYHPNPPNFPPPEPPVPSEEDTLLLMQQSGSGNDSGYSDSSSFRSNFLPQTHRRLRRVSSPDEVEENCDEDFNGAYMCPDSVYNPSNATINSHGAKPGLKYLDLPSEISAPVRAGSDRGANPGLKDLDFRLELPSEIFAPSLPNLKLTLPRTLLKTPELDPKFQRSVPDLLKNGTPTPAGYQPLYASQNSVTLVNGDGTMRSAAAYPRVWRKV